jgi:hypothetical protein
MHDVEQAMEHTWNKLKKNGTRDLIMEQAIICNPCTITKKAKCHGTAEHGITEP